VTVFNIVARPGAFTTPPSAGRRGTPPPPWPDKLDGVAPGRRYEVEAREREFNGRAIKSITKIVPAAFPAPTAAPVEASGASRSHLSPPASGEAEYVGRVMAAFIIKGDITGAHIAKTTARLREIWREADPTAHSDKKG
jgi:hypothetical protein